MNARETGRYWDESAEVWTDLSRRGHNIYRDHLNTPAFFELLPDVAGLRGLDLGCGDGATTALLADRCGGLVALDISPTFLRRAREWSPSLPYVQASGEQLPFAAESFDFVVANMSLMDMPRPELALAECARVLRGGGFLQFSITHPCFMTPYRKKLRDAEGREYAVAIGGYFDRGERMEEWLFSGAPPEAKAGLRPFRLPVFHRTLADWLNRIADAGLRIERALEPRASEETVATEPKLADSRIVAYFLHLRCRKA